MLLYNPGVLIHGYFAVKLFMFHVEHIAYLKVSAASWYTSAYSYIMMRLPGAKQYPMY